MGTDEDRTAAGRPRRKKMTMHFDKLVELRVKDEVIGLFSGVDAALAWKAEFMPKAKHLISPFSTALNTDLLFRPGGPSKKRRTLHLWVWEDVLDDYTAGVAFAYAETEAKAWDALKDADFTAWRVLRGNLDDVQTARNDRRTPRQLGQEAVRPKKITSRYAKAVWGGG